MRIAIVSINYEPELTGIAVYSTGMAEYFASLGHPVTVHTGFPHYPSWTKLPEDRGRLFGKERRNDVMVRRCYLYVPSRPSARRRMLHELTFALTASVSYLLAPRSDVTVIVSPPLALGIPIALLARLKGSRTLFHVQDLQPDAALDLGMLRRGLLSRLLFAWERGCYALVDRVSTISEAMRRKIESKGVPSEKTLLFRNWAGDEHGLAGDASDFRGEWQLGGRLVVLYAGNMGVKQGLDTVLEAAEILLGRPEVRFVVVGDGGERRALEALAAERRLANVEFHSSVPKDRLPSLLATADVSLIPQKPGVKDIVLPSKIGNLLLSRRPLVVAAAPDSELAQLVHQAGCGLLVEPGDAKAMADAIVQLAAAPELRAQMGQSGAEFGRAQLGRERLLSAFLAELHRL